MVHCDGGELKLKDAISRCGENLKEKELEKLWTEEMHEWAKILEDLNERSFVLVVSFMHACNAAEILREVAARSSKLKKRLLKMLL